MSKKATAAKYSVGCFAHQLARRGDKKAVTKFKEVCETGQRRDYLFFANYDSNHLSHTYKYLFL
jgi:hypothetical protein